MLRTLTVGRVLRPGAGFRAFLSSFAPNVPGRLDTLPLLPGAGGAAGAGGATDPLTTLA
jgi:hypothetical protein